LKENEKRRISDRETASKPVLAARKTPLPTETQTTAPKKRSPNPKSSIAATEAALAVILASLDDSKAEEIIAIDVEGKTAMCDRIVVASGRSHRHVAALAEHLLTAIKDAGHGVARVEGMPNADWVLIDQGDVIVHLFRPEVRAFYNIEKMWEVPDAELADEGTVH
jgi:ribosome-associated protein